jgi:hypothetical protein
LRFTAEEFFACGAFDFFATCRLDANAFVRGAGTVYPS